MPDTGTQPFSSTGTAPFFYLRNDEHVVLKLGPAPGFGWSVFLGTLIMITVLAGGIAAILLLNGAPSFVPAIVLAAWAALAVSAAIFAWRLTVTSEYAVTDARIYARVGRLRTSVHFTTHDKITDIRYHRGILDRMFGTSGIVFATAGGNVAVRGVADALHVKEVAEAARDRFIQELLESAAKQASPDAKAVLEQAARGVPVAAAGTAGAAGPVATGMRHGVGAGPGPGPDAPPLPAWTGPTPDYLKRGDHPVWFGKPALIAAIGTGLPVGIFVFAALFAGPAGLVFLPLALVAAGLFVGMNVLRFHHTEFLVSANRVYARSGVIGTTVKQLTYDKITDITYTQDILGRILGYGALTLDTAGSSEAPVRMVGLRAPLEVKELIERTRARYLGEADSG